MVAQGAPEAPLPPEPEASTEVAEEVLAAPVEGAGPTATALALQPPRDTWPGPSRQAMGIGGGAEGSQGGAGGSGGGGASGGADIGGSVPPLPRVNGAGGGAAPEEGEALATPTAEEGVRMLAESAEADEGATVEAPKAEVMIAPQLVPTPELQPTSSPTLQPTVAAEDTPTVAVPVSLAAPTAEALAMEAESRQLVPEGVGEPTAEAEHVVPLDRQPESPWWLAQHSLRLLVGLLTGLLLIALAGTIWARYKRSTP